MNAFFEVRTLVLEAVEELSRSGDLPSGLDTGAVSVQPPRGEGRGEMATNAALVLARSARMPARDLAELLVGRLLRSAEVEEAAVAGPGFINLRMAPSLWRRAVRAALRAGPDYGRSALGAGEPVNVEFVSTNPTGPLHVGHARGAVYGDALASLLAFCGWCPTREYYVNDAGAQVDTLARSAHLRYREALGETIELPPDAYPGDYLQVVGKSLAETFGERYRDSPESEWLEPFRQFSVSTMMEEIRTDLEEIGVRMDVFVSERELQESGRVEQTIADLQSHGLVYSGTLDRPKGMDAADWEPREQMLFRSTGFGDDSDRPLQKADGSWTYFAPDIAYHADKIRRGFRVLVNVWGEDHGGYVRRMKAAVAALSAGAVELDVKICRLVRLLREGRPYTMSKRRGDIVLLRDFLRDIEADAVRFFLLTRKNDAALDLDVARALEQSRDNPVFYVHYAHARVCSLLRKAAEAFPNEDFSDAALAAASLGAVAHPAELAVARRIAGWPAAVEAAAASHEPHRISFYLHALAGELHSLWTLGSDDSSLRFVQSEDLSGTCGRLAVARSAAIVIGAGLGILGIAPREEMR